MKRLIIVGSPRTNGRSAHLAEMLFEANIDEHPEDELFLVPVSEVEIGPCIGCNGCKKKSGVVLKDESGNEVTVQRHRCVFDDDMQTLYDLLDDVDEVTVVSPVYFSGAPAPMKCVLDRMQPYFWARMELRESVNPLPEKRPLKLHVIGEGGDPHGYGALVSEVKSAFAVTGYRLERVLDWVGKIDEAGEIIADADETVLADGSADSGNQPDADLSPANGSAERNAMLGSDERAGSHKQSKPSQAAARSKPARQGGKPRPKLDLHSGIRDPQPEAAPTRKAQKSSGASPAKGRQTQKGSGSSKAKNGKRRK